MTYDGTAGYDAWKARLAEAESAQGKGQPLMTQQARQILAEASVIAEAKAATLQATTTHSAPESSPPVSQGTSLHDEIRARFETCVTPADWNRACTIARVLIDREKHGPRHAKETNAAFATRILAEYVGVAANEVAVWERTAVATIRRIRVDHGRHPSTGDPTQLVAVEWDTIEDRRRLTADLAAQGLSTREIARRVGVDHSVIARDLQRHA